ITAASEAEPASYAQDTEVRYHDALDNSQISDTFKVPINVTTRSGSDGLLYLSTAFSLIVLILIGAGYYVLVMRKKR
ncbi:MAG: S-layer protein, partial [Methanoregula sp.]